MDSFSSALTSLDNLAKIYEIFVPSLNKKVKFKGLTTKQQKEAVKTALDKNITGLTFSNLLNKIIVDNSTEKNTYLLPDRNYIVTALRVLSLSNKLQLEEGEVDLSFVPSFNTPLPEDFKKAELVDENVSITVSIPTLEKDSFVNNETRKKLAPLPDDENFAKESIGEVYVNELIKYIDKVSVSDGANVSVVVLNDLTFDQKVQLVEKLPLNVNSKLVDYINKVKSFEKKYFTTPTGQELDVTIDPTLFTV